MNLLYQFDDKGLYQWLSGKHAKARARGERKRELRAIRKWRQDNNRRPRGYNRYKLIIGYRLGVMV